MGTNEELEIHTIVAAVYPLGIDRNLSAEAEIYHRSMNELKKEEKTMTKINFHLKKILVICASQRITCFQYHSRSILLHIAITIPIWCTYLDQCRCPPEYKHHQ
ncbi:hypothetical protein P5V15_001493 [Pogonomyrmex californicus]